MKLTQDVWHLFKKDLKLEWREKNALSAVFLYVLSTVMVVYQIFMTVEPLVWVSIYWIICLFASVNAAAKSFVQEEGNTRLYYYQLVSPEAMILSKMLFNALLMMSITFLSSMIFTLLLGFPIKSVGLWLLITQLGGFGLAVTFTMISAIASKAQNSSVLMTILGLPLVIPQILILVKLSKSALLVLTVSNVQKDIIGLLSMDIVLIVVALFFFPFLWRD